MEELPEAGQSTKAKVQAIKALILRRLVAKGHVGQCAMCGVQSWVVGTYLPSPASTHPSRIPLRGGNLFPFVTVYCQNCGNTHLVNLVILGFTIEELPALEMPDEAAGA
jgi:hypothetical protein